MRAADQTLLYVQYKCVVCNNAQLALHSRQFQFTLNS